MDEGTSLETIFNGVTDEPAAEAPAPVETQPEPEAEARPRNPDGTFAPKGETAPTEGPSASPAPEIAPEPTLEHPALIGERRRRQDAERERDELRQALAKHQPQQHAQPQPNGPPDRWEEPEAYDNWLIDQATERAVNTADQRMTQRLIDSSEAIARVKYPDYDEKLTKFAEIAQINPRIAQQMMTAPDPAGFAYDYATKAMQVEQYGTVDVEALRARLREEIMAEEVGKLGQRPSLPTSLASERNVGARSGPSWGGPKPLSAILGN